MGTENYGHSRRPNRNSRRFNASIVVSLPPGGVIWLN